VCGYLYTGNVGASRAGSDATHAWVQLYIPNIGWKGFDPTNGVLASIDHVRVGYGRNFTDVTPTAGTLYTAAVETMTIDVTVAEVD
jgi:transglutaminase-like putative cysteine protease